MSGKVPNEPDELSDIERRFVEEYLVDCNATAAARRAGYRAADLKRQAYDTLHRPRVSEAIAEAQAERAARVEVQSDEVLREIKLFAMADPADLFDSDGVFLPISQMPPTIRRAIASFEIEELFEAGSDGKKFCIGRTVKVKLWDKPKGLELLGKHLKLWAERQILEAGSSLESLVLAAASRMRGDR